MITAPYNFVPLSKEVFYPDWAEDISHDIPFEDGESGVIEIEIEAKSPVFIRDSENDSEFCNYKGQYYIPGSSIKGMIRNVLEIMSFSKMRVDQDGSKANVADKTFAIRDLSSAKNFYMTQMSQTTYCGWLKKDDKGYIIENCGIPGRISHGEIDKAFDIDFASKFQNPKFDAKDGRQKTAQYKYDLTGDKNLNIKVSGPFFSTTNAKYDKREFYYYDNKSGKKGTLVLTGQPTARLNSGKMGDGKGFEFLFFDKTEELSVKDSVFENFLFAYFDGRDTQPKESPDWKYWKKKLNNGEKVPVFFQKNNKEVLHFGLSYLYKLPYTNSISHGVSAYHKSDRIDLAQSIFGYVNKTNSLKGRVQFSHSKCENDVTVLPPVNAVLGTPRASYYPNYIVQSGGKYITYMDNVFQLSGWKRYPVHKNKPVKTNNSENDNDNVETVFKPLKEGAVFKGKIRYHNLKRVEIGALLSALTFHECKECYHSIGLAKALGYGKISIKVNHHDIKSYLKEFELLMEESIENWAKQPQLTELLTMASNQDNKKGSALKYMELDEFAKNKTSKEFLRRYSKLDNIKKKELEQLLSSDEIEAYKEQKRIEKEQKKQQIQREIKEREERQRAEKKAQEEKERLAKEEEKRKLEEQKKAEEEAKKAQRLQAGLDFGQATDHKGIERALKGFEKSEENIKKLTDAIVRIYPTLNKKKKNQLERSKDITKWLTKEGFDELLKSLKD